MANYKANLWTGVEGLHTTGVFPECTANGSIVTFNTDSFFRPATDASPNVNSEIHACTKAESKVDVRKFIWGILEQTYVAFTGGRNLGTADKPDGNQSYDGVKTAGSGANKIANMTVAKSALSLVDEDTAKTTYTIVFRYSVDTPGNTNLEVEAE